jgi:hypothetical protein
MSGRASTVPQLQRLPPKFTMAGTGPALVKEVDHSYAEMRDEMRTNVSRETFLVLFQPRYWKSDCFWIEVFCARSCNSPFTMAGHRACHPAAARPRGE